MTSNHKYFESLCAFAISDELTGPELANFTSILWSVSRAGTESMR